MWRLVSCCLLIVCSACGRDGGGDPTDGAPRADARPRADGATGDIDAPGPDIDAPPGIPDAAVATVPPRINEFLFNHQGDPDVSEFVEILGTANADLSALTILEIECDGANAGLINSLVAVDTTNADGFFVTPFLSQFQNGSTTLLLVEGFTGAVGDDIDADNDGAIDNQPWMTTHDAVAYADSVADDTYAGAMQLTNNFDGLDKTLGGGSRIPDGADTDTNLEWTRNDITGEGLPCCAAGNAPSGEARNTPGLPNAVEP